MKKVIIAIVVILGAIALLPIIGNNISTKILKERVALLTSNGLELKNETTESSYITTKKHYEFLLSDSPKFIQYLSQYSDAQIPPYVNAMISGAVVGVDIKYGNFPFTSTLEVDIYPLTLPTTMVDELKEENINLYNYIDKLLQGKGILYHINYYTTSELFDGYIKNVNEEYDFDNGSKISFQLIGATFYGDGALMAPNNLQTRISKIVIKGDESGKSITFEMNDMIAASTFESQSTYASSAAIKTMLIAVQEPHKTKIEATIEDMKVNISSNTQGEKAEFYTKSSLTKMKINSQDANIIASGFNYDISLAGVDKDSYEEFRVLTSQVNANLTPEYEQKLQASIVKLVSKGLSLNVADLSMDKISIENKEPIDGFNMMAKIVLNEDQDIANKLKSSPMSLANNINLASTIKFSKDFYAIINKAVPLVGLANSFAREDGNSLIFEIKLNNGKLTVNKKAIN